MTSYNLLEEWIQIGREEGIRIGVNRVAVAMLREDMPLDLVQRVTSLSLDDLEKLSCRSMQPTD